MDKSYLVYILKCKDSSLYTGITTDIKRRLKEHNAGKGGAYTKNHRPVELQAIVPGFNSSQALKAEHRIKQCRKVDKINMLKRYLWSES